MPEDNKKPRKPKRLFLREDEDSDTNCEIPRKKKANLAAQRRAEEEILSEDNQPNPGMQSPEGTSSTECWAKPENSRTRLRLCRRKIPDCAMVVKEIPSLLADMKRVLTNNNNPTKDLQPEVCVGENERETTFSQPLEDGTTTVSAHCWETAKAQATANGMERVLLMGLFNVDVLLNSNLTGGVNKVNPTAE